jgi:multicomponent Na+:H+ antiporter subunit D
MTASTLAFLPLITALFSGLVVWTWVALTRDRSDKVWALSTSLALLQLVLGVVALGPHFAGLWVADATPLTWAAQGSSWRLPFGITFLVDTLSASLILVTQLLNLIAHLSQPALTNPAARSPYSFVLFHFLSMGVIGAFSTHDFFNLYVWFEVLLLTSFGLTALSRTPEAMAGAFKYAVANLLGSAVFLFGLGLLYGTVGTLNMADIRDALATQGAVPGGPRGLTLGQTAAALCLFLGFAIKAGAYPMVQWLRSAYPVAEIPATVLMSGLLTKVGVYSLIRLQGAGLMTAELDVFLAGLAGLTMLGGVLAAATQSEPRRILSYHIISQVGYMLAALALSTAAGVAACVLYLIHHIIVKSNLFLIAGALELQRSRQSSLPLDQAGRDAGRWSLGMKWLAVAFVISATSLIGLPPLSGFWAKLTVLNSAIVADRWVLLSVALITGVLTLFSMAKIWSEAFLKERPPEADAAAALAETITPPAHVSALGKWLLGLAIALLCAWTLAIGAFPGRVWKLSVQAAQQVESPAVPRDLEGLRK